jgi:ketosteroid isomerase-like protein
MLAVLLASACVHLAQEPFPAPDDPAAVLAIADRAFCAATRERGLEGWLSFFAADAVVFPPTGELVNGSEPIRRYYTGLAFPPAGFLWEPDAAGIATSGDFGWTSGRFGIQAEGKTTWQGRYLSVWQRTQDAWKVVADCGGEPRFASELTGLAGAPVTAGREAERTVRSKDGSLEAAFGHWTAGDAQGGECGGKYLSVWRRAANGRLELAAEIGQQEYVR